MPRDGQVNGQLGMDEQVIEDKVAEAALEARQTAKEQAADYRKEYKAAAEAADVEIARLDLPEGAVIRIGRFRIARVDVPERAVAFETEATTRLQSALVES